MLGTGVRVARAQWAVVVAADPERDIRWIIEDFYWQTQIATLQASDDELGVISGQLDTTNLTLAESLTTLRDIDRRLGEPTTSSVLAFGASTTPRTSSTAYIRQALSLGTVMNDDDGGATLSRTNQVSKTAIGNSYTLDGTSYDRDTSKYRVLEQEEKLRDVFKQAVTDFHDVQKKELDFQEAQATALTSGASTVTEIQARHAAIESSRGRVDMAKNRMELAKAELDAFVGQIDLEDRKIEAASWEEKEKAKALEETQNTAVKTLVNDPAAATAPPDDTYDY